MTSITCQCSWCGRQFSPRTSGGREQIYCTVTCRRAYDAAARTWVRLAIAEGYLTVADLKRVSASTRALPGSMGDGSPVIYLPGAA
jgi:hypothetical protein